MAGPDASLLTTSHPPPSLRFETVFSGARAAVPGLQSGPGRSPPASSPRDPSHGACWWVGDRRRASRQAEGECEQSQSFARLPGGRWERGVVERGWALRPLPEYCTRQRVHARNHSPVATVRVQGPRETEDATLSLLPVHGGEISFSVLSWWRNLFFDAFGEGDAYHGHGAAGREFHHRVQSAVHQPCRGRLRRDGKGRTL